MGAVFPPLKVEQSRVSGKKTAWTKTPRFFSYKKNCLTIALFATAGLLGIASIVLKADVLIFASLGAVIWGTIIFLATVQKVVKVDLASMHLVNSTLAFDALLSRFGYDGTAVIVPPKTIGDNPALQISHKTMKGDKTSFTPLGLDLAFFMEKKSPVDLFLLEFDTLTEFLSKMFTDELELASGFVMWRNGDLIQVRMTDFIFQDMCKQIESSSESSCKRLLCPICSSIACLISKATRKSISLDRMSFNPNTIEICFRIHEPESV